MSLKKTLISVFISLFLMGGIFVSASTAVAGRTYKIAVVVHGGTTNPFWKIEEKGIRDIAAKYPDLEVTYLGPKVYNFEEFMDILKTAIDSKPDALICTLTYPELMDDLLRPPIAGGLPVIGINAADMREPAEARIPILTYIGEDSYRIGVTAAKETLKRFTPKRALFCNHHPGADNIDARGRGWVDTMKEKGIPAEQIDITADPVAGTEIVSTYLTRYPETDALFITNVVRTITTIARLEADGYEVGKDIKIAQMDVNPELLEYLKNEKVMFTMDQQPYLQSYLGVMLAYLHVKYNIAPPPPPLLTGPGIVTKENIVELLELSKAGYR